jgi:hypothetical protein
VQPIRRTHDLGILTSCHFESAYVAPDGVTSPSLEWPIGFPAVFDALALDAEGSEVSLARRRGSLFLDLLADGTFGLVVKDEFVPVLDAGGVKLCNLGHRYPLWR